MTPAMLSEDEHFMARALELGRLGSPSPNPHVGAVVVHDGVIVGEGFHERAGQEHAESAALRVAGERARGATVYVTLEPCNHQGRTPPCTEALIRAGVARVVVGCRDPNPHVSGGGSERLKAAGIEITSGVLERDSHQLIAPWAKWITTGLPYVSLKLALSLDGRIATRTGASKWITGELARQRVHALRAANDAVAIGIGTALADDPMLTVRDAPGTSPLRVIFDTKLRLPPQSRLATSAAEYPTWIMCSEDATSSLEEALARKGIEVLRAPRSAEGRIDVTAALRILAHRGIVSFMAEGGAELGGSLLAAQLVDELHVFVAPMLLGPRGRPGAVDWAGPDSPAEAPRIASPRWELCGEDAYVHGPVTYPT